MDYVTGSSNEDSDRINHSFLAARIIIIPRDPVPGSLAWMFTFRAAGTLNSFTPPSLPSFLPSFLPSREESQPQFFASAFSFIFNSAFLFPSFRDSSLLFLRLGKMSERDSGGIFFNRQMLSDWWLIQKNNLLLVVMDISSSPSRLTLSLSLPSSLFLSLHHRGNQRLESNEILSLDACLVP